MVTVVLAGLVVSLVLDVSPAAARRSHPPDLFRELFGPPVRSHGRAHQSRARHEKRANEKAAPEQSATEKPATEPKPETRPEAKPAPEKEPHETQEAAGLKVPLPQPRPAEAPKVEPDKPAIAKAAPGGADKPHGQAATATPTPAPTPEGPPPPSACRLALTEEIAIAPSVPDIHGPGGCGGEDLVRLEAILLPSKHRVSMKPAAIMRCSMAAAVADWVRNDVQPIAQGMGTEVTELENLDAYECRGRNGISGAPLSEHGLANAIDVHAFKLANGQSIGLTERNVPRPVRESVLHSVCARFTTVLGPGSDGYHEDHIHLDLRERHNNYKICQWNIWDPLPQIAPLMPESRPDDAPPRQVADKDDGGKSQAGTSEKSAKGNDGSGNDSKTVHGAEPQAHGDKANGASESKSDSGKSKSNRSGSSASEKSQSTRSKSNAGKADESDLNEPPTKKRRHGRRS